MANPFELFYTSYKFKDSRLVVQVELNQLELLSKLCAGNHSDFPALPPNWEKMSHAEKLANVNIYNSRLSSLTKDMLNTACSVLLEKFCNNFSDQGIPKLWENYYRNICYKVVWNILNICRNRGTILALESLLSMSYGLSSRDKDSREQYCWIVNPTRFLEGFNSGSSTLDDFKAWSYKKIKNGLCSEVRAEEDPYFQLTLLGIVTNKRTSFQVIRNALESSNFLDAVNHVVQIDYPNPEESKLRKDLNREITNHLSSGMEEQFNRCRILVKSLNEYLMANRPLTVNRLIASDWLNIGDYYQNLLNKYYKNNPEQSPPSINPSAIIIIIKSIGMSVRNYVKPIKNPISIKETLGNSDVTLEDIIVDGEQPSTVDWLVSQSFIEQSPLLYRLIDEFCQLPPKSIDRPSHQQILWLRYGLALNMTEISDFLHTRFRLSGGPGGASLRCTKARTALVRTIHQGISSTKEPLNQELTVDAIKLVIEVLTKYYENVNHQLIKRIAIQLGINSSAKLIDPTRTEFINIITTNVEQMSRLNLDNNICKIQIEKIVKKIYSY